MRGRIASGLLAIAFASPALAQTADKFTQPWASADSSIVLDPYEGNPIDWDKLAGDAKVVGLIHRATSGSKIDGKYADRAAQAKQRGYLWGAYHLGRPGDGVAQADFFLSAIGDPAGVLIALDLEDVEDAKFMDIPGAIAFLDRVKERTGRTAVIYANHKVTQALSASAEFQAKYGDAPLWYARFRPSIRQSWLGAWDDYLLWQFSSELNCTSDGACPYNPPGVKFDMDVNVFWGTKDQLAALWAPTPAEPDPTQPAPTPEPAAPATP